MFITHDLDEALRLGNKIAIMRDGEVIQQGTCQDIVLNPADEYISNFVQEINRGRVILVETIMQPLDSSADVQGPAISETSHLEDAARLMSDTGSDVAHAVDSDGAPSGSLTVQDVMSAIVTRSATTMRRSDQARAQPRVEPEPDTRVAISEPWYKTAIGHGLIRAYPVNTDAHSLVSG